MRKSAAPGHQAVRAYQEVKACILRGDLLPGSKLSHAQLCRLLGMSSTPIREALARLVQEGYAVQVPNAGFFVQHLRLEEAAELYDAREALETFIVGRAARVAVPDTLRAVDEALERYEDELRRPLRKVRLIRDREFHLALAHVVGNQWLERTLAAVLDRIIMKRTLEGLVVHRRSADSLAEHRAIVRWVEKGEGPKAVAAMRGHIRRGKTFVLEHLRTIETMRHGA